MDENVSIVVLIGFMGAGKTTTGRILAQKLNWEFVDLDDVIENLTGYSVPAIFATRGESEFRRLETQALMSVVGDGKRRKLVLALGGGAYAQPENVGLLQQANMRVVFLDARIEELRRRCATEGDRRPLFADQDQFSSLYEKRRPSYLRANIRIDTEGKSANTVVDELLSILGLA